jgi:DNA repair photolyase
MRPTVPPDYPDDAIPEPLHRGRGALSNESSRFDSEKRIRTTDGWETEASPAPCEDDDELPPLRTTLTRDATRTILARNTSPDVPFDRSINPYRGCEHGCIYCFARPTHAYLGHSLGLDFESRLYMKPEAAKLLDAELRKPGYKPKVIAMGTNTDPYQPIERRYQITRQVLEVLNRFNHPAGITTKSANVLRDIDILADMAKRNLVKVFISVTTLDRDLARTMEPRASTPELRLKAIAGLHEAGVPVGVSVAPIIPALTDMEIESIIERAAEAGADSANFTLLRLPLEIKDLFIEWLEAHAPLKTKHVMDLVQDIHGGRTYNAEFHERMQGSGAYADLIRQRVQAAAKRFMMEQRYRFNVDCSQFKVPRADSPQGDLFALPE